MRKEERAEYGKIVYCSEQKWNFFFLICDPKMAFSDTGKEVQLPS